MRIVIFAFLSAYFANAKNHSFSLDGKIMGGFTVNHIEERPYIVSLRRRNIHFGTATLINAFNALTAAQIFKFNAFKVVNCTGMTMMAGIINLADEGMSRPVLHVVINKNYNEGYKYNNDIALVAVLHPFNFSDSFEYIGIPSWTLQGYKGPAYLVGWGSDCESPNVRSVEYSPRLKEIPFEVYRIMECRRWLRRNGIQINYRQICARPKEIEGNAALGDVGGPLIFRHYVIGIYSYRSTDGLWTPSLYTLVLHQRGFIGEATEEADNIRIRVLG